MRIWVCILFSVLMHWAGFFVLPEEWEESEAPQIAVRKGVSALTLQLPVPKKTVRTTEQEKPAQEILKAEQSEETPEPDTQSEKEQTLQESGDEGAISLAAMKGTGKPKYPFLSQRRGEKGTVVLMVTVSEKGKCIDIEIVSSSGYRRLDRAAVTWARKAEYTPAQKDGAPVSSKLRLKVPFEFTRKK